MCCLLYLGEYTQIPHLDKVPNFPSLDYTWYDILLAIKAVTHFHPNLPLFDWHQRWWRKCGNVSKTSKPSSGSNALMPLLNMWHQQPFTETKDTINIRAQSKFFLAWLWNKLGSPAETKSHPNSQALQCWWGPSYIGPPVWRKKNYLANSDKLTAGPNFGQNSFFFFLLVMWHSIVVWWFS